MIIEKPGYVFTYSIQFDWLYPHLGEIYEWCEDTFGEAFNNSVHQAVHNPAKWTKQRGGVRFTKLEHAEWFVLRWSGIDI